MLKEQEKNEINSLNNNEESSFENISGEEEDEDDLLKSESETNKSSNKNIKINKDNNSSKNIEILTSKNKNINNNNSINNNDNNINNNIFEASIHSSNNSYLRKSEDMNEQINSRDRRRRNTGPPNLKKDKEEKNNETENEDEDEEDVELEDSEESILKPYEMYKDSDISYKNILDKIKKGFYIYGIKSKIYYVFLNQMPYNKNKYLFIKAQQNEEDKINYYNNIILLYFLYQK